LFFNVIVSVADFVVADDFKLGIFLLLIALLNANGDGVFDLGI